MARPNLSYLKNLTLAALGVPVGAWSGLTSMGAALVLSPVLAWMVGARGRALNGAAMVVSTVAALAALVAYVQVRALPLSAAFSFAVGAALGAMFAATARMDRVRTGRAAEIAGPLLAIVVGAGLLYAAGTPDTVASGHWLLPHPPGPTLIWSAVAGVLSGLLGRLGNVGGLLSAPALLLLTAESPRAAQATTLFSLVLLSAVPTMASVARRDAPTPVMVWPAFGAALGALIGSRVAVALLPLRLVLVYGAGLAIIGTVRLLAGPTIKPAGTAEAPPA